LPSASARSAAINPDRDGFACSALTTLDVKLGLGLCDGLDPFGFMLSFEFRGYRERLLAGRSYR
jgi:hypothetical protein